MRLREVMHSPPAFVQKETPLWRAAREMKDHQCGFLPVVERGVPVGVLTARDLAVAVALDERCPYATTAREIMSGSPAGLPEDATLDEAYKTMIEKNLRHLVVLDDLNVLRGVVSLRDLANRAGAVSSGSSWVMSSLPPVTLI